MKPPKTPKKKVTLGTRERHQDEQQLDGLLVVSSRRHKPSKKMTAKKKFLHREKTPSNSSETTLKISKKKPKSRKQNKQYRPILLYQTVRRQIRNKINNSNSRVQGK
jgi:hypothetical protein